MAPHTATADPVDARSDEVIRGWTLQSGARCPDNWHVSLGPSVFPARGLPVRRRCTRGATLVEVVVATIVLGIAVPPLVALYTGVAKHSVDASYQAAALVYADSLMEELASKAFEDPDQAGGPTFVAALVSSSSSATVDHSVSIPAHASGDVLVLAFTQKRSGASPATPTLTPAGWTVVRDGEAGGPSAVRLTAFTKVGDGVEAAVNVTTASAAGFGAVCCAYRGVAHTIDVAARAEQESGEDMTAPSVTTTVPATMVVWCHAFDDNKSTASDVSSHASFQGTLRGYAEHNAPDQGFATALSDRAQDAAGATGPCVFRTNGDSDAGCAITLALVGGSSFGTEEALRAAYDDIDDFDGASESPPRRIDGTPLDDYTGFTRTVSVVNVTAADPDAAVPEADGSTGLKRVTVTVTWTGGRGGELSLSTLRARL